MEYASIINTVETANVITVKRLLHAHKSVQNDVAMVYVVLWNTAIIVLVIVVSAPKCLGVVMVCVIMVKTVGHVLGIVARVLQQNIVGIIFVIMAKHAIHVEQTAIRALMCVGMVNAQAQRIV
jgi:hypothetical protein